MCNRAIWDFDPSENGTYHLWTDRQQLVQVSILYLIGLSQAPPLPSSKEKQHLCGSDPCKPISRRPKLLGFVNKAHPTKYKMPATFFNILSLFSRPSQQ